eukprot:354196-Chlamydomonas_euryale.AAC.19
MQPARGRPFGAASCRGDRYAAAAAGALPAHTKRLRCRCARDVGAAAAAGWPRRETWRRRGSSRWGF